MPKLAARHVKVYYHINDFRGCEKAVVTTGTFDGVHLGHRRIISRLRDVAAGTGGSTVLLTFDPHPRMVLFPERKQLLLNALDEKIKRLGETGIDHLIIHPFTREFSMLSSQEFIHDILVGKLGTHKLVIGYDHHFGRNREGSFEHLSQFAPQYGFEVEEIPALEVEHVNVSSTRIREALSRCDVSEAANYLGYNYSVAGTVVKGDQIGRTIGYPTANIQVNEPYKLVPADGIYAVTVHYRGQTLGGMLSIGVRPTIAEGLARTIEVNIFNFDKEIYGEHLEVHFIRHLRPELKFENLEALKLQLAKDREDTIDVLAHEKIVYS